MPGEAIVFNDFFDAWAHRPRDEFLAAHRVPHLIVPRVEPPAGPGELADTERVDPSRTVAHWDLQLLVPVVSAGQDRRIFLGRGADNDIVLPDPRVSKLQCWFERRAVDGAWLVGDAGSSNGTRVDAVPVPRSHGVLVHSGARIRIAEALDLVFVQAEALWRIVERVRAALTALERG